MKTQIFFRNSASILFFLSGITVNLLLIPEAQCRILYVQEAKPVAMTEEEILKELKSSPPLKGEILFEDKIICHFDSEKGNFSLPSSTLSPGKVSKWIKTKNNPNFRVKFTVGDNPSRLLIATDKNMTDTSKIVIWTASAQGKGAYQLSFAKPLKPGAYEFAVMKGTLVLYTGVGFQAEQNDDLLQDSGL